MFNHVADDMIKFFSVERRGKGCCEQRLCQQKKEFSLDDREWKEVSFNENLMTPVSIPLLCIDSVNPFR